MTKLARSFIEDSGMTLPKSPPGWTRYRVRRRPHVCAHANKFFRLLEDNDPVALISQPDRGDKSADSSSGDAYELSHDFDPCPDMNDMFRKKIYYF